MPDLAWLYPLWNSQRTSSPRKRLRKWSADERHARRHELSGRGRHGLEDGLETVGLEPHARGADLPVIPAHLVGVDYEVNQLDVVTLVELICRSAGQVHPDLLTLASAT